MTGLVVFDMTLQTTHVWLDELMNDLGWQGNQHQAYLALRTVLHALRDWLTVEEAVHLGTLLPMLIRGFYYEGWKPGSRSVREGHPEEFLVHVRRSFSNPQDIPPRVAALAQQTGSIALNEARVDAQAVARAVFKVFTRHLPAGEMADITHGLPAEVRELWLEATSP